jgi:hypothetical protein
VHENRALGTVFEHKKKEIEGDRESCIMKSFKCVPFAKYYMIIK